MCDWHTHNGASVTGQLLDRSHIGRGGRINSGFPTRHFPRHACLGLIEAFGAKECALK
jgi:hypothetical protein